MNKLSLSEMENINGGRGWGILAFIGGAIAFFIGVLDGYTNPSACRR